MPIRAALNGLDWWRRAGCVDDEHVSVAAPILLTSPHVALIAALQSSDPEPAIEQTFPHISTSGADLHLLLQLASGLVRAGLAGLADITLKSAGAKISEHDAVRAMLDQIGRLPSGEVPSQALQQRFIANVNALRARKADPAERLAAAPAPFTFRVFQSRAGNLHAIRHHATPRLDLIFPLIDARRAAATLPLPPADLATSFLLVGVPSPHLLRRLLESTADGYRPPIDIIEGDPAILAIWLHMIDDPAVFADGRVSLFTGSQAVDDYRAYITRTPGRIPASLILTNHRPPAHWNQARVDGSITTGLARAIRQRQIAQRTALDDRYHNRDAAWWRARFANARKGTQPLRIVGFTSRYSTVIQHAMRDLASAFARRGHAFEIACQRDDCCAAVDVAAELSRVDREVDLLVAINHLRFEYADAMPRNVPFVGWIQDHMDHLWKREAGASVKTLDLVITHSPHVLTSLYGYPADRMLASSNLTDPHVYDATPLPVEELRPHLCDVSFISHGAATPEMLVDELGNVTTPSFHTLLRCFLSIARDELDRHGCASALRLIELMLEAEKASDHAPLPPDVRRAHVYPQIAKIHDRLFRHQTLEWAANWARSRGRSLRIYGRGWNRHPSLATFSCGEVASGRELRSVYQASSVSVQANAYASLHQRLLDGVACGACVISRYNPADFVRQPFAAIAYAIQSRNMSSLEELLALREKDNAFAGGCAEAERLSSAVIAGMDNPRRREQVRVLREANNIPELLTDDGLFEVLRDMRFMPARVANDLPGFDKTMFRNEAEMHALLDQLTSDQAARSSVVGPMRQAVLAHDTFDVLVDRILRAFAEGVVA
jgi:hypothetical protein